MVRDSIMTPTRSVHINYQVLFVGLKRKVVRGVNP